MWQTSTLVKVYAAEFLLQRSYICTHAYKRSTMYIYIYIYSGIQRVRYARPADYFVFLITRRAAFYLHWHLIIIIIIRDKFKDLQRQYGKTIIFVGSIFFFIPFLSFSYPRRAYNIRLSPRWKTRFQTESDDSAAVPVLLRPASGSVYIPVRQQSYSPSTATLVFPLIMNLFKFLFLEFLNILKNHNSWIVCIH